jgi:Mg-chelatase subunit ChlD
MIDTMNDFNYEKASTVTADDEEEDEEVIDIKPCEYIFLIDRSGSMSGQRINLAVEALTLFVHSIPYGSMFNIVSYGSSF